MRRPAFHSLEGHAEEPGMNSPGEMLRIDDLSKSAAVFVAVGPDALTAVWQMALFDRGQMASAAILRTARLQGKDIDPGHDEEPGRIIQQARSGPLDRPGQTPFARYADYASPFDFTFAVAHAYACQGELALVRRHWDVLQRILDWARDYGDILLRRGRKYCRTSSKVRQNRCASGSAPKPSIG